MKEFGLAGFQPFRRPIGMFADDDNIDDWMAQRNAEAAGRQDAETAGREAWEQATRSGQDLDAPQPHDLVRLGAQAIGNAAADRGWGDAGSDASTTASPDTDTPIERAQPINPDGPLLTPPRFGFAAARRGDSISKLVGTSDPAAIGRFLSLNGMGNRGSTIYSGGSYAVPTQYDDATPDEIAAGHRMREQDNVRIEAAKAQRTARQTSEELWAQRLNAGLNTWTGEPAAQPQTTRPRAHPIPPRPSGSWLDNSAMAKRMAGDVAETAGQGYGLVRGGWHTAQGLGFLARLANPLDPYLSPDGDAAWDQAVRGGRRIASGVARRFADPKLLAGDLHKANIALNPQATPVSGTMTGELQRKFGIGANQGETAFNVGSVLFGGEVAKGLEGMAVAREAPAVAAYVRANLEPELADYMLEPYEGMGAHYVPRRTKAPSALGGGRLPTSLIDSRFNVSRLSGANRWQQYKFHFMNDPKYSGGPVRGRSGKGSGWSGERDFGWERNGPFTRVIAGMPADTKGLIGGAAVAGLNSTVSGIDEEQLP